MGKYFFHSKTSVKANKMIMFYLKTLTFVNLHLLALFSFIIIIRVHLPQQQITRKSNGFDQREFKGLFIRYKLKDNIKIKT